MELHVQGMHCKSCKMLVEDELEEIGATDVTITLVDGKNRGTVRCNHEDKQRVINAIQSAGDYTVTE